MRRVLVLACLSLITLAPAARAQVHIAWDDCGTAGATDKTFACDVNTGSHVLYCSFIAPAGTTGITGAEGVFDLQSTSTALPEWWGFGTGNCRAASLSVAFNTPCASALDYWDSVPGGPFGGFAYYPAFQGVMSRARIKTVDAIDGTKARALIAGSEYFALAIRIDDLKTTGAGACAGCATSLCFGVTSLTLTQDVGLGDYRMSPSGEPGTWVSWQGAAFGGGAACPGVTPVRNSTWGQVKTLYR